MKTPSLPQKMAATAVLAFATLCAQPVSAQDTFSWTWAQKVGDVLKFRTYTRITARMADNSGDIVISTRSESKHDYKAVAEDGTITYEQLDEKAEAILNGAPIPPAAGGPDRTFRIARSSRDPSGEPRVSRPRSGSRVPCARVPLRFRAQ